MGDHNVTHTLGVDLPNLFRVSMSLAQGLKILWAPIVDAAYFPRFGRRHCRPLVSYIVLVNWKPWSSEFNDVPNMYLLKVFTSVVFWFSWQSVKCLEMS